MHRGAGGERIVSLAEIARILHGASGAAELFAAHSAAASAPTLFRPLNSGDVMVLDAPAPASAAAAAGSCTQDLALQRFVGRVREQLLAQDPDDPAPPADAAPAGSPAHGTSAAAAPAAASGAGFADASAAESEGDEQFFTLLENVAIGTGSVLGLPPQLRILVTSFAHAHALAAASSGAGGGGGTGGGVSGVGRGAAAAAAATLSIPRATAALLVRLGRWRCVHESTRASK